MSKQVDIWIAQGICSPMRPKVLATLSPYGFKDLKFHCWAEDEDGTNQRSDDDSMAMRHVCVVSVNRQAARWCEYVLLRNKQFRLMSRPLDPRNEKWAAQWDTLPRAWRQEGCTAKLPDKQPGQPPAQRSRRRPERQPGKPQPVRRKSLLSRLIGG